MVGWPRGVPEDAKPLITQVLWTLRLDFNGEINSKTDAARELIDAMRRRGIPIDDEMGVRMLLPHLDGGRYGKFIQRVVLGRRTAQIKLACTELPDEYLERCVGSFADAPFSISNTAPGDPLAPSAGIPPAPGDAGASQRLQLATSTTSASPPPRSATTTTVAPDDAGDNDNASAAPGDAGDRNSHNPSARRTVRDYEPTPWPDGDDDIELTLRREEPATTRLAVADGEFDALMAELEAGLDEAWIAALDQPAGTDPRVDELLERYHKLIELNRDLTRRAKDTEARLEGRSREVEALRTQLSQANARYERLDSNMRALQRSEAPGGRYVSAATRVLAEVPAAPRSGRNRRRTGGDSQPVYSVG